VLVSVVIPTKSRPQALYDAVCSVFNGRYQNFELFVIDQTPDESTRAILQGFMADRRFHYVQNRRPGFGAASSRNMGIAMSSGEVIAIMDDDVEAQPDWMAQIVAEFSADPMLEFIAGKLTAPAYNWENGFTPSFDANPHLSRWQFPLMAAGANFSMRRSLFDKVGGYDEYCGPGSRLRASDDTDLCWRIMRSGAKWKICPHIEVIHTHGFREIKDAQALTERYNFGNGGNYGRFTRRGDLTAGAWFLWQEAGGLARGTLRLVLRRHPSGIGRTLTRLRGFWAGLRLPPHEGFVSPRDMQRLHADYHAIIAGYKEERAPVAVEL
jgi:glycosyltransferase involved in cell wall biosynthesis